MFLKTFQNYILFCLISTAAIFVVTKQLIAKTTSKASGSSREEVPVQDQPSFSVDEAVSERIYQHSLTKAGARPDDSLLVDSSWRIFMPAQFTLKNKYFSVPYAENSRSFSGIMIAPQIPIGYLGSAKIALFSQLGYIYGQDIFDIQSDSGLAVKDAIELQWLPLQGGLELSSRAFTTQNIRFGLLTAGGVDWLTQSGQLDGVNQTFWVPRYEVGANLALFSPDRRSEVGFSGIRLSALLYRSFATAQTSKGWAADVGTRYAF